MSSARAQNIFDTAEQEKESDGYLVYFEPDVSQNTIDSVMNRYNSYEVWITDYSKVRYWKVNSFPFTIDDTSDIYTMDDLYGVWVNDGGENNDNNSSNVGSVLYNYKLDKTLSDPLITNNIDDSQGLCNEYFNKANTGATNVIINILDTGFDFEYNESAMDELNIINGYNFVNNSTIAQDDNGHGTHITSIINALSNGNSVSVIESKTHNSSGTGKLSDIVRAIDYSIEMNVDIINASWSFYAEESEKETPLQIAIKTAGEYGILFIAAAGNDAIDNNNDTLKSFPASYSNDNILSVSSNACDSTLSLFSNYGSTYSDICSPGEDIPGIVLNGQLDYMSGTSQSTAYVSAAAAIIGSHLDYFDPLKVKQLILDGAKYTDKLDNLILTNSVVDINNSLLLLNNNDLNNQIILNNNFTKIQDSSIYPNPFNEYVFFELNTDRDEKAILEIFDISGKRVKSQNIEILKGNNSIKFNDLNKLLPGIYYVKFKNKITKLLKTN